MVVEASGARRDVRRRGGQRRGIGSEMRRSPRERRERRAENVIETRERSEPIAGTPPTEPPPMLYLEEI